VGTRHPSESKSLGGPFQNPLGVGCLGRTSGEGLMSLGGSPIKVETPIPVSDPYLHPIKIPIPVIMAPKYKEHGSCSWHSRNTCKELLLVERQLT
jgi:hypothetical protein